MAVVASRNFYYGLALYARQVQLSLHRCYESEWGAMAVFLFQSSRPEKIREAIEALRESHSLSDSAFLLMWWRLLCLLRIRTNKVFLTTDEANQVCFLLDELSSILCGDYPGREEVLRIRLCFVNLEALLESRLGWARKGEYAVAHFAQSSNGPWFAISHFVGIEWPNAENAEDNRNRNRDDKDHKDRDTHK